MVSELNRTREHEEIKLDVLSQMRISRDELLILVSVVLVNIVNLLEVKIMKFRFQTRSPCWQALVSCTCVLTCFEMKSHQLQPFFPGFWNALKKQLNFVRLLTCAKTFIFEESCTITEELENRNQKSEQKLWCEMKTRTVSLLKIWGKNYRTK